MAITQQIQQFPDAPNSQTDTPTEFNAKADAFVHHQSDTYVTEVNTWATQANALEGVMNQIKTDVDNTVATIPAGSINDTLIATDKVWSSTKVSGEVNANKIENGHGANGSWTKFPDGTLICNFSSGTSLTTTVASGALFSSTSIMMTFPVPFIGPLPQVIAQGQPTSGYSWGVISTLTKTEFKFYAVGTTNTSTNYPSYIAIGRWK